MNGKRILTTVIVCALLASVALAAETIHFREGGGTGYTDVTFDDTWFRYSPSGEVTHGNDGYDGIQAVPDQDVSLIAVKAWPGQRIAS